MEKLRPGEARSETGNWNVADSFVKLKIMMPMIKCEAYEDIALNGYEDFVDELGNLGVSTDELRIRGLRRLINELIKLAKNTLFAMKKVSTEKNMIGFKDNLEAIRDIFLPRSFRQQKDEGTGITSLKINKEIFDLLLEKVSMLKSDMNLPLNQNHLIFWDKEEFDPKAFKERIKQRIITQG